MKNTNLMKFEGEGRMMKSVFTLFVLVASTLTVSAQKTAVLDAFSKHGIDATILNPANVQEPDDYAFDFKQTTIAGGKTNVTIAKFDPSRAKEEQWTVVSMDGKSPSNGDIKTFRKGKVKPESPSKADDASYRIESESAECLVVSYKPDPASLPKDAAFLKDCRLYMSINLKSKKLEQVQGLNEKPLKIKILNAEKLELTTRYTRNEETKRYFPVNEGLNIQAKFIGQAVNVQTITEYSNYSKK
ncbi:hypothetical protein [Pedobacter caeni]|uniref:Uncharacterized protein n=1 Tax=Pedobacter caeni TaxID=288992 RepID=A0A1M4TXI1_9SPHI|nr:hypothetical protein [Pedobacter caeni]SHE49165.1 hypothetical protein SAMN04488522_101356 [Pedobacter caeni]